MNVTCALTVRVWRPQQNGEGISHQKVNEVTKIVRMFGKFASYQETVPWSHLIHDSQVARRDTTKCGHTCDWVTYSKFALCRRAITAAGLFIIHRLLKSPAQRSATDLVEIKLQWLETDASVVFTIQAYPEEFSALKVVFNKVQDLWPNFEFTFMGYCLWVFQHRCSFMWNFWKESVKNRFPAMVSLGSLISSGIGSTGFGIWIAVR